jgi:hypothetical protein
MRCGRVLVEITGAGLALALLGGCVGDVASVSTGAAGAGAGGIVVSGSGGSGGSGLPSGGGGATGAGGASAASAFIPARIRRLTNAEYDASVQALLGTAMAPSVQFSFPPDARQGPTNSPAGPAFTVNDAQRVDPVLADKLDAAAQALVTEARRSGKLEALAPCANTTSGGEACAKSFVLSFGAKAYRRALTDDEVTGLVSSPTSVYHVGADGYTYGDGIDVLTRVLLQSAGFLYITELGDPGATGTFALASRESANVLAYLLTSAPPDDTLLTNAASGLLATPDGREQEARRLLVTPAGRARFVRVVREWLGIDDVAHREKAQSVYPAFTSVSQSMENESRAFIDEVLNNGTGTLAELLTADWTIADAPLAAIYGVTSAGAGKRTSLASVKRRGILNQGAFLSVFANNNSSHPVFRGVALMRRIACLSTADPGALGIVVSFPAADASKTTRARFDAHTADPGCASCHTTIDAFGFALENFDGMGIMRTTENNLPVVTQVTLAAGSDVDGTYADSIELGAALAGSTAVKACLARQIFRSSAARSDATVANVEDAFVEIWKQLPASQQGRLADVLVAYVRSPLFVQRRTP